MQGKRIERIAALIKEELSVAVTQRMRDPRIGFATVTHVEVSDDVKYAKVYYSVLGTEEQRKLAGEAFEHSRGFLQKDIAQTLKLRFTPHLDFLLDTSLDEGMKIDKIIRTIHNEPDGHAG